MTVLAAHRGPVEFGLPARRRHREPAVGRRRAAWSGVSRGRPAGPLTAGGSAPGQRRRDAADDSAGAVVGRAGPAAAAQRDSAACWSAARWRPRLPISPGRPFLPSRSGARGLRRVSSTSRALRAVGPRCKVRSRACRLRFVVGWTIVCRVARGRVCDAIGLLDSAPRCPGFGEPDGAVGRSPSPSTYADVATAHRQALQADEFGRRINRRVTAFAGLAMPRTLRSARSGRARAFADALLLRCSSMIEPVAGIWSNRSGRGCPPWSMGPIVNRPRCAPAYPAAPDAGRRGVARTEPGLCRHPERTLGWPWRS